MKKKIDQIQLFENKDLKVDTPSTPRLLYFVTCRYNYLEILATGFVKPKNWMIKYHSDLNEFCPDGIALFSTQPPVVVASFAISENPQNFPVVLEVAFDNRPKAWFEITRDYQLLEKSSKDDIEGLLILTSGLIPAIYIKRALFLDQSQLEDFNLHLFNNLDYEIKPDLLDSDAGQTALDLEKIKDLLTQCNGKFSPKERELARQIEATGGAFELLAAAQEKHPDSSNNLLMTFINSLKTPLSNVEESTKKVDFWKWTELLSDSLYSRGGTDPINIELEKNEKRLLSKTFEYLLSISRNDFSVNECQAFLKKALIETETTPGSYNHLFEKMNKVRRGLMSIEQFLVEFPSNLYPGSISVLIFFMRNSPEEINQEIKNRTFEVDSIILSLSAAITGCLYGKPLIGVEYKPQKYTTIYGDQIIANFINSSTSLAGAFTEVSMPESIKISLFENAENTELEKIPETKRKIKPGKKKKAVNEAKEDVTLGNHSEDPGDLPVAPNQEKLQAIKDLILKDSLTDPLNAGYRAALSIARLKGWQSYLTTIINLENREYVIENRKLKQEFRIQGLIEPEIKLSHVEEFKIFLGNQESEIFSSLPDDLVREINETLEPM